MEGPTTPAPTAEGDAHFTSTTAVTASATTTSNFMNSTGTVLRPVIFVVDAISPVPGGGGGSHSNVDDGADEPFDVRRTSELTTDSKDGGIVGGGRAVNTIANEELFDTFLAALQGKTPGNESEDNNANNIDEDLSVAASCASSAPPFSPGTPGSELDGEDIAIEGASTHKSTSAGGGTTHKRFMSPFQRLRKVGRWKQTHHKADDGNEEHYDNETATGTSASATTTSTSAHHALAHDMENDPDDSNNNTSTGTSPDHISAALSSYSKDNPPVHFMSKRARIVNVARRHAFPPSKFPQGKMDHTSSLGSGNGIMLGETHSNTSSSHHGPGLTSSSPSSWMSSYEIQNEGILPSGWIEKHARALPSAVVVVTTLKITSEENMRVGIRNAVRAVEDLRLTLAEKRCVPIHLVCLFREDVGVTATMMASGEDTKSNRSSKKNMIGSQRDINTIREKICQECTLPQSQVFLLKVPTDLEPDEFETAILRSPYTQQASQQEQKQQQQNQQQPSPEEIASKIMINPLLRQLDRSLRDTSALYYSRLAEAHERKLMLWRNRYHNTNASFEVNTLMAAMRCARYAIKVGILREFQMRTGSGSSTASSVAAGAGAGAGGLQTGRWTDRSSSSMRHYDEAYRWVVELHRRSISWRVASLTSGPTPAAAAASGFTGPAPITPGGKNGGGSGMGGYSMDDIASPKLTESPGGGIGVELSLPGNNVPPPPSPMDTTMATPTPPPPTPPMRRNSPALTSKKGYNTPENIAFFALLWEQCRAVASILNAKLLRSTNANTVNTLMGTEAEEQWSRHRIIFLSTPQGVPNFHPAQNDDFFGPAWHRFVYITEELLTFACIAEGRWRRTLSHVTKNNTVLPPPFHHPPAAPWKAYSELSEAVLGLSKVVKQQLDGFDSSDWVSLSAAGAAATGRRKFVGSYQGWQFENESKRDHKAMALDYVLHALDLLDENISLCTGSDTNNAAMQPSSSARMHYLAARLLMKLDNPKGALVHLKIIADQTKGWPSLNLSIQRALSACEERCAVAEKSSTVVPDLAKSKDSCIELLLRPDSCKMLSPKEKLDAQAMAWRENSAVGMDAPSKGVVWNHDDASNTLPPFEFAVSFLKSTHATSGDTVKACVSIKSCLDYEVCVESIQMVTTAGIFDVSNLDQCMGKKSLFQSLINGGSSTTHPKFVPDKGVQFNSNDLVFFVTEIPLPNSLSDTVFGGSSADTSKFIPKSGRICNMGLSHAAGNICESRAEMNGGSQPKISINGKPIALSAISESSSSFLGGIPFVCHGLVLSLKPTDGESSPLKLQIERPRLVSPLLRSGTQRLVMEECNYTAHSWSRPIYHPYCLGPRVLRVLGPRPQMHVTNLTDLETGCKAVSGTVNRIILKIKAGKDEDCWDVRARIRSESVKKSDTAVDATPDVTPVEPHRMPCFVQKAADPKVRNVTETGVALPEGWETRKDVTTDNSPDLTTTICPHLEAGKSLLFPLDIFRPLDEWQSRDSDASISTSYEIIIMYRQIRGGKETKEPNGLGDQVLVVQSGSIDWVSPLSAEFSLSNGLTKPYSRGIQHASNAISSALAQSSSVTRNELIAADGERVHMRCSLQATSVGMKSCATILRVTNENESNERRKALYSSDSGLVMNQGKHGTKLSLSYTISAQKDIENSCDKNEMIPLGVISVHWKPISLPIGELPDVISTNMAIADEFASTHGPLGLANLNPVIFYGPQCQVLNAPFDAKMVTSPSTPKVSHPFCISYQVTNRTAKSQSLMVSLRDMQVGKATSDTNPLFLCTGKMKEETQLAPFEERIFSFTLISMSAGRVLRPSITISSGRHQSWVINETDMSSRYLFVMP